MSVIMNLHKLRNGRWDIIQSKVDMLIYQSPSREYGDLAS